MVCLIQLDIKIYRKGNMNKLNKLFNSIGNNTIENEKTSLDIINEYLLLENQVKLKRNEKSIYGFLGCRNGGEIISKVNGITKQDQLNELRSVIVNNLLLPIADLSHLSKSNEDVEDIDNEDEDVEKSEDEKLEVKMAKYNSDYQVEKTNEQLRSNAIRTMANRICFPLVLLIAKGNQNYKYQDGLFEIFVKSFSNDQIKKTFGVNLEDKKAPKGILSFNANLTQLDKLSKIVLFRTISDKKDNDVAFTQLKQSAKKMSDSKDNSKKILKVVKNFLDYFDKNKLYAELHSIEKHIFNLENYGQAKEKIVEDVRKQTKRQLFFYGDEVVAFEPTEFKSKNFTDFESQFNKKYLVK